MVDLTVDKEKNIEYKYYGGILEPPNVRYTLSFVTGDIIDWDVRHFFDKVVMVKVDKKK